MGEKKNSSPQEIFGPRNIFLFNYLFVCFSPPTPTFPPQSSSLFHYFSLLTSIIFCRQLSPPVVRMEQHTTQKRQNREEFDMIEEAISLFREWMRNKLVFTGRTKNANKCARILPLFQRFVNDHASFFVDNFNYIPHGKAGARGSIFALFRDDILPTALRMEHVRSDVEGDLSTNQERLMKKVARNNGQVSARSIEGWEMA